MFQKVYDLCHSQVQINAAVSGNTVCTFLLAQVKKYMHKPCARYMGVAGNESLIGTVSASQFQSWGQKVHSGMTQQTPYGKPIKMTERYEHHKIVWQVILSRSRIPKQLTKK